jgi:uncharacterized zinc-type alcohol dehydrogenase-like protein
MKAINAYAAYDGNSIKAFTFERKELCEKEVQIEILYSGVCHQIHTVKGDWGPAIYPLVPGHEIVGKVTAVAVSKFKVGEIAGVGCFVDSRTKVVKQVMNNFVMKE